MIRDADIAMYEAKGDGRGCFKQFHSSMRDRAQRRWELDLDLRQSLELRQFSLVYQPIIDLKTGEVESVEALIRWNHPERGVISPIHFIPVAEETGMIVEIGEWVARTACEQFAEWYRIDSNATPFSISINVSRQQLIHRNFSQSFQSILQESGVHPASLHLEVTESEMMKDLDSAVRVMQEMRATGVRFALDDFGTGYSSLACLHQIPIDVIKLDRSLIATIDQDDYFLKLASLVMQLMSETQIKVIAEGIETLSQFTILQDLDCSLGQGYFFSKPLPADKVQDFIRKQRAAVQRTSRSNSAVAIPIVQFMQGQAIAGCSVGMDTIAMGPQLRSS
jgi:EAL domain-containing protein (putative c-di-GMP-specific phosphodiesterase class I)